MKSYGVKIAAGAVTVLFGAYAAAIAQKDRQDNSDSWTAESPLLDGPASPIAVAKNEDWLTKPVTELQDPTQPRTLDGTPISPKTSVTQTSTANTPVQLVQHTTEASEEPASVFPSFGTGFAVPAGQQEATIDNSGPAESFVVPALAASSNPLNNDQPGEIDQETGLGNAGPNTDWLMPETENPVASNDLNDGEASSPAMAIAFSGNGAVLQESTPASEITANVIPVDAESAATTNSDSSSFAVGPAIIGSGIAAMVAESEMAGSAAPENMLRGSATNANSLRSESATVAQSPLGSETQTDNLVSEVITNPSQMNVVAGSGTSAILSQPSASGLRSAVPTQPGLAQQSIGLETNSAPVNGYSSPATLGSAAVLGSPGSITPSTNITQTTGITQAGTIQQSGASNSVQPNLYRQTQEVPQADVYRQAELVGGPASVASLPAESPAAPGGEQVGYQPANMVRPNSAQTMTLNAPGERRLEGTQTPSIVIHKRAPREVKVGKPASFVLHVQNVGSVEALNVEVHDQIPSGMRLVDASPSPMQQGSLLLWELGAMPAGDERTITLQLVPEQEGELGSVARVSFEAAASVRTISTRPELKIVQRIPQQGVLIGQQLEIELEVSNPGSGAATGVILQEDVPEGLEHPKGRQLDNALGTLAPGEVRNQVLRLRAVSPGLIQNTIRLVGDDGLQAEHTVAIQVIAPNLLVELSGPSKRFLERQATYQLNVANNGTADATNVEIAVQLDRGFTFVSTDYEGQYDPTRHAVFWSLSKLPAGGKGSVPLTLLPVEEGEQAIKIEARADLGVTTTSERTMTVEGFAELSFAINNAGGPIEIGAETSYEVVVENSGSKPDSNVRVQIQIPPELELVSTDSQAGTDGRGLVAFQPKSNLAPGEQLKHSLRVRGLSPGTHIVRAVVVSDQSKVPVTKEDTTRVYSDQ